MCLSVCRHHVVKHVINGLLVTDCDKGSSGLCKIEIVKDEFHLEITADELAFTNSQGRDCSSTVGCLPSKYWALSSILSTTHMKVLWQICLNRRVVSYSRWKRQLKVRRM